MKTELVEAEQLVATASDSDEVPDPATGTVTGLGVNVGAMQEGRPNATPRVTEPENLFTLLTVTVTAPVLPSGILIVEREKERV